ncbi:MAG: hypothetical protein VB094_06530 [Oscillibacter sp.]|nr:hypothetical protein [Oscillibacter sp.]
MGSQTECGHHACGRYPRKLTPTTKKQGSSPEKKQIFEKSEKISSCLTSKKRHFRGDAMMGAIFENSTARRIKNCTAETKEKQFSPSGGKLITN